MCCWPWMKSAFNRSHIVRLRIIRIKLRWSWRIYPIHAYAIKLPSSRLRQLLCAELPKTRARSLLLLLVLLPFIRALRPASHPQIVLSQYPCQRGGPLLSVDCTRLLLFLSLQLIFHYIFFYRVLYIRTGPLPVVVVLVLVLFWCLIGCGLLCRTILITLIRDLLDNGGQHQVVRVIGPWR